MIIRDRIPLPTETMGSTPRTSAHKVWMARANGRRNAALPIYSGRLAFSGVMDQAHEAFILMILMMAMKQRQAWVIGNEVDLCGREPNHVQRILHQP